MSRQMKARRALPGDVPRWLHAHASYDGDGCLTFPFARNGQGYGVVKFEGRIMLASRAMCTLAHGQPSDPSLVAAHSCGNGHLGCVNPKHLRWATGVENAADLALHRSMGLAAPTASKLGPVECAAIREARGRERLKITAKRYGISESMVCRIQKGNRRAVA